MHPLDAIAYAEVDALADKFGWTRDFGPKLARSVASVVLPSGSPSEPFRIDECARAWLAAGLVRWKGQRVPPAQIDRELFRPDWRAPDSDIREALLIVALREGMNGARPLVKGEKPLIPRNGWWFDPESGFAHPVAEIQRSYRTHWENELRFVCTDPFTGALFDTAGVMGLRSPDRTPIGWRGSSYYHLA